MSAPPPPSTDKLRVFVSSTHKEWHLERQAIAEVIESLGHQPVMSETVEGSDPARVELERELPACDVVICLLGKRYGFVPATLDGLGVTEWELRTAHRHAIPSHIFIRGLADGREPKQQELIARIENFERGQWFRPIADPAELATSLLNLSEPRQSTEAILAAAGLPSDWMNAHRFDDPPALEYALRKALAQQLAGCIRTLLDEEYGEPGVDSDEVCSHYLEKLSRQLQQELKVHQLGGMLIAHEFHTNDGRADSARRVRSSRIKGLQSLADVVERRAQPLVLKGEPGCGKTTVLRRLTLQFAENLSSTRIPFRVRLNRYRAVTPFGDPIEPLAFLRAELEDLWNENPVQPRGRDIARLHATQRRIKYWFRDGRVIFFADAMDELPLDDADRAQRWDRLKQFTTQVIVCGGRAVLTCRERDYPSDFGAYEIVVPPLDAAQVREFVRHTLDAERFSPADRHRVAENLLSDHWQRIWFNLFTISLLTSYLNRGGSLDALAGAANQAQLFAAIIDPILTVEVERLARDVNQRIHHGSVGQLKEFAGGLALRALESDLAGRTFESAVEPEQNHLLVALRRTGLLTASLRFQHHRLAEYFAAWYLSTRRPPHEALGLPPDAQHLRELTKLYASMTTHVGAYIESLLPAPLEQQLRHLPVAERRCYSKRLTLAAECAAGRAIDIGPRITNRLRLLLMDALRQGNRIEKSEMLQAMPSVFTDEEIASQTPLLAEGGEWLQEAVVTQLQYSRLTSLQLFRVVLDRLWSIRSMSRLQRLLAANARFALLEPRAAIVSAVALVAMAAITLQYLAAIALVAALPYAATHFLYPRVFPHNSLGGPNAALAASLLLTLLYTDVFLILGQRIRRFTGALYSSALATMSTFALVWALTHVTRGIASPVPDTSHLRFIRISGVPEVLVLALGATLSLGYFGLVVAWRKIGSFLRVVPSAAKPTPTPRLVDRIASKYGRVLMPTLITAGVLGYAIGRMPLALAAVILDVVAVLYVIHRQRKSSEAQLRGLELEDGTTPDFGPRILSFLETAVSYDHQSRAASLLGAIRQPGPDLLGHIFRLVERGALDETVRDLLSEQYLRLESNTRVAAKGAAA